MIKKKKSKKYIMIGIVFFSLIFISILCNKKDSIVSDLKVYSHIEQKVDTSNIVENAAIKAELNKEYNNLSKEEVLDVMYKIQNGDMSYIDNDEAMDTQDYSKMFESGRYELVLADVNRDGYEDIVWRTRQYGEKPYNQDIYMIISYSKNGFQRVFYDAVDGSNTYFLSKDNQIISRVEQGGIIMIYSYSLYNYDTDWNPNFVQGIKALGFYDLTELPKGWIEEHYPNVTSEGMYFIQTIQVYDTLKEKNKLEKIITEEEFLQIFKEMTGFECKDFFL